MGEPLNEKTTFNTFHFADDQTVQDAEDLELIAPSVFIKWGLSINSQNLIYMHRV